MSGFRRHGRRPLKGFFTLQHRTAGQVVAEVRDISETGVFLLDGGRAWIRQVAVGDAVELRETDTGQNVVDQLGSSLRIVRLTDEGAGFASPTAF